MKNIITYKIILFVTLAVIVALLFMTMESRDSITVMSTKTDTPREPMLNPLQQTEQSDAMLKQQTEILMTAESDTVDAQNILLQKVTSRAVSKLRFDEYGQLIIDDKLQTQLKSMIARLPTNLSDQALAQLNKNIMTSLPNEQGEKFAQLAVGFYQYKQGEELLLENLESSPDPIVLAKQRLEKNDVLRRSIFSQETVEALFGERRRKTLYHIERSEIQQDITLTAAQRVEKIAALEKAAMSDGIIESSHGLNAHQDESPIDRSEIDESEKLIAQEWQNRYQMYLIEKQRILNAGIDDQEQAIQIEALLKEHYSESELAGARAYDQQQSLNNK